MRNIQYEVVVFKRWYMTEDRAAGRAQIHKSVVKACGYEDARRIEAALNATGQPQKDEERWCEICVRAYVVGKTVLIPAHMISGRFIDEMQQVYLDVHKTAHSSAKGFHKPKLNGGEAYAHVIEDAPLHRRFDEVEVDVDDRA